MKIFLGADHRGFNLKEKLKLWLRGEGFAVVDVGNTRYDPEDDFPDYALVVAEKVARENAMGVLLCGSGGMAMAANKVKGIRAVEVFDVERAKHAKAHDNANIISLPADAIVAGKAKKIVKAWLEAELEGKSKRLRRLKKIKEIEDKYFK